MPTTVMMENQGPEDIGDSSTASPSEMSKAQVAALTPGDIRCMSRHELARAVRSADLPLLAADESAHLEYLDRPTLERLVYLARRCCRNRGD